MTPKTRAEIKIKVKDEVKIQTGLPNDFRFHSRRPFTAGLRSRDNPVTATLRNAR